MESSRIGRASPVVGSGSLGAAMKGVVQEQNNHPRGHHLKWPAHSPVSWTFRLRRRSRPLPLKGLVSFGGLLGWESPEKKDIRIQDSSERHVKQQQLKAGVASKLGPEGWLVIGVDTPLDLER